jgi:putative hydrolase
MLLERTGASPYRSRAFRTAAATLERVGAAEVQARARAGTLEALPGLGSVTAALVREVLAGETPAYVRTLEEEVAALPARPASVLLDALRGDCHVHSNWSDGYASIREMAEGAIALGHEYIVLTDHSPSLKIARGLEPARLIEQLGVVAALNDELAPFRILTGIEVDILADGSLDQEDELLAHLDVVVGSLHSLLRSPREAMTERMLTAIANPHLDILGHCTGRMRTGKRDRPESEFDARRVFSLCARLDKAVEVNSLPARRDPPSRLIKMATELGCRFAIDSDAHSPGQLDGKAQGCERASTNGVEVDRVVNALEADELLAWARSHDAPARQV